MKSIGSEHPLLRKLRGYFQVFPVPPDSKLLVAVSGGSDSTALAVGLCEIAPELSLQIVLAYFNHRLRSEQEGKEEVAFLRELSTRLGILLITGEAGEGELYRQSETEKRSLEDIAREHRYQFLYRTAREEEVDYICTAHTATDSVETQIIRFFQGSSPAGLRGIRPMSGKLLRPLIRVNRSEVKDFLQIRKIIPREDRTNRDVRFLRNGVRHRLLPVLEGVFPGFPTALYRLGEKMDWVHAFLEEETRVRNPWKRNPTGWECRREEFFALPPILRLYSMYNLYDCSGQGNEHRFPFGFLYPLLQKIPPSGWTGVWEQGGIHLSFKEDHIYWESNIVQKKKKGYLYILEGDMDFSIPGGLRLQVRREKQGSKVEGEEVFTISGYRTLMLRSRRPGDCIRTAQGRKSVKKLLSELKIPSEVRELVPVLQGEDETIAVLAGPFGGKTVQGIPSCHGKEPITLSIQISKIPTSGEVCE